MSHIKAVKCDFCSEAGMSRLFEVSDDHVHLVGKQFHICKMCMQREPTPAERIRYLNIAINWVAGAESHPAYIREKTEIAINTMSIDFLLGSLDIHKQQEFIEQMQP